MKSKSNYLNRSIKSSFSWTLCYLHISKWVLIRTSPSCISLPLIHCDWLVYKASANTSYTTLYRSFWHVILLFLILIREEPILQPRNRKCAMICFAQMCAVYPPEIDFVRTYSIHSHPLWLSDAWRGNCPRTPPPKKKVVLGWVAAVDSSNQVGYKLSDNLSTWQKSGKK